MLSAAVVIDTFRTQDNNKIDRFSPRLMTLLGLPIIIQLK